jgi:tetratricopeptide (TPR) repeat protein
MMMLCALMTGAAAPAQDLESQMRAVEVATGNREWRQALELLLPLVGAESTAAQCQRLAGKLDEVGKALQGASDIALALRAYEAALAVQQRQYGDRDAVDVAMHMHNIGVCLETLGRAGEALPRHEAALAMAKRIYGDGDHPDLAMSLGNVAHCLQALGRAADALPLCEGSLAMRQRLHGDQDHPTVARGLNNIALCLNALGRTTEALPLFEQSLSMRRRLHGDRDHIEVARGLNNLGLCQQALGRAADALPRLEESLAMRRRLCDDRDNADVATGLNTVAACLLDLGRVREALPLFERGLSIWRRLHGDRDHAAVAINVNNIARCWKEIGRADEALPLYEASLAMRQRLFGASNHPLVATSLNNLAGCLDVLGRDAAALPVFEAALQMRLRLYGDQDHTEVAVAMGNVAHCLDDLGRPGDALRHNEAALAMHRRLHGDRDHADVALGLANVASCLKALGRTEAALPGYRDALAMLGRLYGDADHPDTALALHNLGGCLRQAGRDEEALVPLQASLAMSKRLQGEGDHARVANTQAILAGCLQDLGRRQEALAACESAVAMSERLRDSTLASAELRQSLFEDLKRGGAFERLQQLAVQLGHAGEALHAAERSRGRELLDQLAQVGDLDAEAQRRANRRGDDAVAARLAALQAEIASLRAESDRWLRELMALDEVADDAERTHRREAALARSDANATALRQLLDERARLLGDLLPVGRVREAAAIQASLREGEVLLVFTLTAPAAWLYLVEPDGPVRAVALPDAVAAANDTLSVLLTRSSRAALDQRGRDPETREGGVDAVASSRRLFASLVPSAVWERVRGKRRVFVAAHRALHRLPFESLVTEVKDGVPVCWLDNGPPIAYVPSGSVLHWLRTRAGARASATLDVLAVGDPLLGGAPATPGPGADPVRFVHHGDFERIGTLPQLQGARAETEAIAAAFRGKEATAELLLGGAATEPAVFELAAKAKYLHFACHGIAEEYAGQSLSLLVLAQPKEPRPGDDGFLKLGDLHHAWSGRLDGCRLVTLSACRTNVGPTLRDEAPQALPLGFLFAGAPAVISSLWAVDDASTKELMVDFYSRLLAGETDTLQAFTAAKKALRTKYPDPFHWAPFLYMGSPD